MERVWQCRPRPGFFNFTISDPKEIPLLKLSFNFRTPPFLTPILVRWKLLGCSSFRALQGAKFHRHFWLFLCNRLLRRNRTVQLPRHPNVQSQAVILTNIIPHPNTSSLGPKLRLINHQLESNATHPFELIKIYPPRNRLGSGQGAPRR